MRNFAKRNRLLLWILLLTAAALTAACGAAPTPQEAVPTRTETAVPPAPAASAAPQETASPAAASPTPPPPAPTATSTPPPAPVRFAVIGDYGDGGEGEASVAALVQSWQVDFVVTAGDNNYRTGSAETIDAHIGQFYHAYIAPYRGAYGEGADQNRFFPVPGNHDWGTGTLQPYLDYFSLPGNERYYTFTWGAATFFMLDSDWSEPDGNTADSAQAAWLRKALSVSRSAWNIVVLHHPPYSSARHGNNDFSQWPYALWGADAVIGGHDHTYERIQRDGIVYFVNGLGGAWRYDFEAAVEGSQVRYNGGYGAMLVEADPQRITYQFINTDGEVVDTWTVER